MDLEADFHTIQSKFKDEIKAATVDVGEGFSPKYWWNKDLDVLFRRMEKGFEISIECKL